MASPTAYDSVRPVCEFFFFFFILFAAALSGHEKGLGSPQIND